MNSLQARSHKFNKEEAIPSPYPALPIFFPSPSYTFTSPPAPRPSPFPR